MYRIALFFLIAIATHAAVADQSGIHNLRENEVEKIAKASEERFASLMAPDKLLNVVRRTHNGKCLTAIDFPIGALGGSVIRMNGKAEREWWHIFNNTEEREGTGKVPNSFFAIRTHLDKEILVRALQTGSVGSFEPMQGLTFYSEYPFGYFDFVD